VMSDDAQVAANLVQPGWLLRVVSEDVMPVEEWLEVFLVLHTKLYGDDGVAVDRVWIYLSDRAKPLIYKWDDVVQVRQSVVK
jgi:hypothetical protein